MRCYKSFDELYLESEIEEIVTTNETIHIKYDPNKKDIIFLLGILFASGKRIQVDNLNDIKEDNSLITKLVKHWHSNKTSLQIPINSNYINFNSFFIFQDNKLSDREKLRIRTLIEQERKKGYTVTTSGFISDNIYGICKQNATALANSNMIYMYYNSKSRATMFDLGMIYYFNYMNGNRTFRLLNQDLTLDINDFGDRVVQKLIQNQEMKDQAYNKKRYINE